jgi:putative DNA primase/helicase
MSAFEAARAANAGGGYKGQHRNYTAVEAFKNAVLDSIGCAPDEIIADGSLHRFKIDGKLNGAYVLHLDSRPAGYFEDFKQGIKQNWKLEGDYKPPTNDERNAYAIERQRQIEQRQAEQAKRHDDAVQKAAYIWQNSEPATDHPYLTKKRVKAHGLRVYKGSLVVPVFNNGAFTVQFIDPEGNKRFRTGSRLIGSYSELGQYAPDKPILVAEGWATGASLFESTGNLIFIAFSAGNLTAVALHTRKLYPNAEIVIAGDHDLSGIGQKAARGAALAVGGKYLIPPTAGNDWNDELSGGSHE